MVSLGRALGARSDDIFSVQLSAYSAAMRSVANVFYMVGEMSLQGLPISPSHSWLARKVFLPSLPRW